MSRLRIDPEDYGKIYADSTFEVEGYDDQLEQIRTMYPEETKSEADKLAEQIFDPESELNQGLPSVEESFGEGAPNLGIAEEIPDLETPPEGFFNTPEVRQPTGKDPNAFNTSLTHRDGSPIRPEVIAALRLDRNGSKIDPREKEISDMIRSTNMEEKVKGFNIAANDPILSEVWDFNNDGKFSFSDMFDTSTWNGGKGITAAEDEQLTKEWLNGVENKDFGTRLRSLLNQIPGAGDTRGMLNKLEFMVDRRRLALAPLNELEPWENAEENTTGGFLEWGKSMLSLPEQVFSFATGGKFGGHDAKLDDWVFNTKNKSGIAFLIDNPTRRQWGDGIAYELGYWVPEGIVTAMTLGAGSTALAKHANKLPHGKRLALAVSRMMEPRIGMKSYAYSKHFAKGAWVNPTGPWRHLTKLRNLAFSATKAGYLETFKGAMQRDLTIDGMGTLYNENDWAKQIIDAHPDSWWFGTELQYAIESPVGKRFAYWMDEGRQDSVFAVPMFGIFKGAAGTVRFGGNALNNMRTSTGHSWPTWSGTIRDGKHWWEVRQRKQGDLFRAGEAQMNAEFDPANPMARIDGSPVQNANGKGLYKNPQAANNPLDGTIETRSNVRQVANDADVINNNVIKRPGSTDSLLDPVDLAATAKGGLPDNVSQKLAKEFVEDPTLSAQLKSLDFASRTNGGYGEGTFKRIQEIQGRDAASLSPREYWGKDLLDSPLKVGDYNNLDEVQKFVAENLYVADAVNVSLLTKLRDLAAATSEAVGKQDIFAVNGAMERIQNNLIAGLSNVKKTRATWSGIAEKLRADDGKLTPELIREVNETIAVRSQGLHDETVDGVKLMMNFLKDSDSEELVEGVLDVFKVANDIHNWQDFDAWMRQKVRGGEFRGKVKTGAMIHELQGVMVNSILSGPKTPLRAIMGTTTNAYLNALNEVAGATIRRPFTGDLISQRASMAKLKGMFEVLPEAWHIFKENWNAKFTADFANIRTRYSEAPTRNDYNWKLFGEWTERNGTNGDKAAYYLANQARTLNNNKLLSWSPRAMAAIDDTFKWLLARVRSKELGMRQAFEEVGEDWSKLTPEIMKKAEDYHFKNLHDVDGNINLSKDSWLNKQFKEITLTSELKGFSAKLDGLLNETPLLKPFYLFARTGINGLNLSYKNTPLLGVMHKESLAILSHQGDDFTSLMKYGIENANDLANARNLFAGRQAVGATVVTGMAGMYIGGQLTGNGPADRQLKQQWINAGWKPNHFYIGDVGFDYSSLEPFNVIFSAIADIGDNMELMGSEWAEKRLQAVAFVIGRGLTGKTYMSGLDQLMQIVQMKPNAWNKTAANIFNNSIPLAGMRNEFGKWINPHMKELNSDMWDSLRNRNQWAEGFAAKPLPEKSDLLNGTPIKNWNIIGRSFNAISPIQLDIRRDSPGRRLLMESNYDLKSTTYAYGGYSFVRNAHVRAHFQNAIGKAPIEFRGRKFKNLEEALGYISTLPDIKNSMAAMQANKNNPSKWAVDPNTYPHNTIIDRVIQQARSKAWAMLNNPNHPGYSDLLEVMGEQDGKNAITRDNRQEILNLSYPHKPFNAFPKKTN